jgi:para-nitrobenzyl esterase
MKKIFPLFILCLSIVANAQNTIVKTVNGKIEGTTSTDKTVLIFKGIPFAAAPVGDLRWRAPQPVHDWEGIRQCTGFAASPIQNRPEPIYCWTEEFIAQPEPLSEDCLYLNVWTTAKSKNEKQPVFLWIYGGGLSSGSANCAIYDGEALAKKGIVFVSINYRVGALGFMAHPELSKESGYHASGNYGFLDQIAALKWVQKNIAAFGGDPDNVTIAGQSAGAFSVTALIASPLAKGLFHKAIAQSGGLLSNMLSQNLSQAEEKGVAFMKKANSNSIADLRKKTADELQALSNDRALGRFGTTLDGYVLPLNLLDHFKKGAHNQVPVLTGWVTGDGSFLGSTEMTVDEYEKEAQEKYGTRASTYLEIFPATSEAEVKAAKQKLTLLNFAALPAHLLASFNTKATYLYQFGHVPPDKPDFPNYGAFHTSEVPYALHTLHTWSRPWQQWDKDLENIMSSYWVNFAKTGNPNGRSLPEWKSYDKQVGNVMLLNDKVEGKTAFLKNEFTFLEMN